ncbi:hypothetical protein IQ251_13090 [Saccharopolyspora sp. HNM0983]|uniref:Uncharacterized protein n=1 Tax=Saccharopolyspora montiporae TaxID=2781240 RepID=A0A929FY51_9PSEU|nr:hypothetical protein [Saccharopolyspora sp. HNM0983]MBE9375381.1 hypothetical protein [Saccharopolyspora sp. HNM0983]
MLEGVWQALEGVGLQSCANPDPAGGRITALSVDRDELRVLLRVSAVVLHRDDGRILTEVEDVRRRIPGLSGISVEVKPHLAASTPSGGKGAQLCGLPPPTEHGSCLSRAQRDRSLLGWFVEEAELGAAHHSNAREDEGPTARVLIRAGLAASVEEGTGVPRSPLGAA